MPTALGIIRAVEAPTYDKVIKEQIAESKKAAKVKNMDALFSSGNTWEVE
jgi:hypothetical protein